MDFSSDYIPLEENQSVLSLFYKSYKRIPYKIHSNHPIKELLLTGNCISELPSGLGCLEKLDLSYNSIENINEDMVNAICSYSNLKFLSLKGNSIKVFPFLISNMEKLDSLVLSENKIECMEFNPSCRDLDLSCNQIKDFKLLSNRIYSLNLSFNRLSSFFSHSNSIENLNLSGNDIKGENFFLSCLNLKSIDLSYNFLFDLSDTFQNCLSLERIDVSYNILEFLPRSYPGNLIWLYANNNKVSDLSDSLYELKNLRFLYIQHNMITKLKVFQSIEILNCSNNNISESDPLRSSMQTLNFENNQFSVIPDLSMASASIIHLSNNKISNIDVSHVTECVSKLDLCFNNIRSIPSELFFLPRLQFLLLNNNQIHCLPNSIVSSRIQVLSISNNPISDLPPLPSTLQILLAHKCSFCVIPDCLSSLSHLNSLDMSENELSEIPYLPKLETIRVSCNNIRTIPDMPSALDVDLSHNRLFNVIMSHFPKVVSLDLSHNNIKCIESTETQCLEILKMSHNPISGDFSLSFFPKMLSLDFVQTDVNIIDVPKTVKHMITSNSNLFINTVPSYLRYISDFNIGYSDTIGCRDAMEDSMIIYRNICKDVDVFAIVDGHAGSNSSSLISYSIPFFLKKSKTIDRNTICQCFDSINQALRNSKVRDGAVISLIVKKGNFIISFNIGDSRAIIVRTDGSFMQLSTDHKPTNRDELERIRNDGSFVKNGRIQGILSVSRALGDFRIKAITSLPTVTEYELSCNDFRIVICCDGVFDVLSNEAVSKIALQGTPSEAAYHIRNESLSRFSSDNISVIVINV